MGRKPAPARHESLVDCVKREHEKEIRGLRECLWALEYQRDCLEERLLLAGWVAQNADAVVALLYRGPMIPEKTILTWSEDRRRGFAEACRLLRDHLATRTLQEALKDYRDQEREWGEEPPVGTLSDEEEPGSDSGLVGADGGPLEVLKRAPSNVLRYSGLETPEDGLAEGEWAEDPSEEMEALLGRLSGHSEGVERTADDGLPGEED